LGLFLDKVIDYPTFFKTWVKLYQTNTTMADLEDEKVYEVPAFLGMQDKTTEFVRSESDMKKTFNTRFDMIGALKKSEGYSQQGSDLTSTSSTSTSSSTTTTSTSTSTSSSTTTTSTSSSTTA
jgi:hypothetical protein